MGIGSRIVVAVAVIATFVALYPENPPINPAYCSEVIGAQEFPAWEAEHGPLSYRPEEGIWLDYKGAEVGYSPTEDADICA